ncbi:ABC transporter ATP-binding protein [Natronococcus sp. A-GB1]|uniref:ABC transporter ATP-binding protein n=1 Tax=Natronococcus sp. A-GB1 TaxID=3037648 RepID=UPI00241DC025|nr:ABC transporter ATP-binding protein [Natronococcus sp. A-GB1]MDG5761798.1 ABC transporter ATP-binding protein [Natronococcus sp. A-GB1]
MVLVPRESDSADLIRVRDLTTRFYTEEGQINAVESINFTIQKGEIFGIVGESGSGKSVAALSLIDLIEEPGRIVGGEIWYRNPDLAEMVADATPDAVDGAYVDILQLSEGGRHALRGSTFSMIFQDPMSSFNPSVTVGEQIAEAVEVQRRASANPRSTRARTEDFSLVSFLLSSALPSRQFVTPDSKDRAIELLEQVGIPDPAKRAEEYPYEYSGGMLQRAMIAQALAGEPEILIADEPTTALDVTIQSQILQLLSELQDETGLSIVLISHNLGVISRICDRVGVMYAGELIEKGDLSDIHQSSVHPYTQGLLDSIPDFEHPESSLQPIPGNVPSLLDSEMGDGCYFADRCPKAMTTCREKPPEFTVDGDDDHTVQCYLAREAYDPAKALEDNIDSEEPDATASTMNREQLEHSPVEFDNE